MYALIWKLIKNIKSKKLVLTINLKQRTALKISDYTKSIN